MNLFLKMRIKTNPNYINKLSKETLTEESISYAMIVVILLILLLFIVI